MLRQLTTNTRVAGRGGEGGRGRAGEREGEVRDTRNLITANTAMQRGHGTGQGQLTAEARSTEGEKMLLERAKESEAQCGD